MMLALSLQRIAEALGEGRGPRAGTATGLCIDSRRVKPGDVFFALSGSRTSGERFIDEALDRGATAVVTSLESDARGPVLKVADPRAAMLRVAALVRDAFQGPVLGITGTAGKTTLKEFLRALTPPRLKGVFPEASFNNALGVSLTLAAVEADTDFVVLEMGTSAPGEIRALARAARPTMGVLTSIGPGHLEGLRSEAGVLEEKLDLARALPAGAPLFVNAADAMLREADYPAGLKLLRVGLSGDEGDVAPAEERPGAFRISKEGPWMRHHLRGGVAARALFTALVVAGHLGASEEELAAASPTVRPPSLRGEVIHVSGAEVVLDCYNSNPLSLAAALDDFEGCTAPRACVLGDMLELGEKSPEFHAAAGRRAARMDLDWILFIGSFGRDFAAGFEAAGGDAARIHLFADVEEARGCFRKTISRARSILIKGSRGTALERLLEDDDA